MARRFGRRAFIFGSAIGVAGCATRPERVAKYLAPNERLNVGAIGAGGMGRGDITRAAWAGENVIALCDVDENRAAPTFEDFPKAARYRDWRVMLEKENLDAVTISTPDHTHAHAALAAMQMGIHVYVQKPLTHSIHEARVLTEAAERYGVATQMGNQGHSGNGVREMCEMVWAGAIGPVREVHCWTNRPVWPQGIAAPLPQEPVPDTLDWDLWLGPAPYRNYNPGYAPFNWRGWWDFGTGALGDMACHIMDPPYWALDLRHPERVEVVSQEGNTDQTGPLKSVLKYEFGARGAMPPVTFYWYDGGEMPPRPAGVPEDQQLGDGDNGSFLIGDKGILTCGAYGGRARLLPDERMEDYERPPEFIPRMPEPDVSSAHMQNWLLACKSWSQASSNFGYSGPFTEMVLLGNLALRTGESVEWDAANMRATNNASANALVRRRYRRGWELR